MNDTKRQLPDELLLRPRTPNPRAAIRVSDRPATDPELPEDLIVRRKARAT